MEITATQTVPDYDDIEQITDIINKLNTHFPEFFQKCQIIIRNLQPPADKYIDDIEPVWDFYLKIQDQTPVNTLLEIEEKVDTIKQANLVEGCIHFDLKD